MELVEIRDLDGPNLFLRQPAIKLEIDTGDDAPAVAEAFASAFVIDHQLRPRLATARVPVSPSRLESLLVHDDLGALNVGAALGR